MTERFDSQPEKLELPFNAGYEWRVQSALLTESVVALGDMRTFLVKVTMPYNAHLTEDEAETFTETVHEKIMDVLLGMGKL